MAESTEVSRQLLEESRKEKWKVAILCTLISAIVATLLARIYS